MDLLRQLLNEIERDDLLRERRSTRLIFLGDLIDRGPDSAQVLSLLSGAERTDKRLVILMGNHEEALIASMDGDERAQQLWLEHGGSATLTSFGIDPKAETESAYAFSSRLSAQIPTELIEWIRNLPCHARSGSYYFCHAGVRPGVKLARQKREDLLWIRDEFLHSEVDHQAVVVHGHSMCGDHVQFAHNRINVDTGAYQSGILSAVGLQDGERWVISTASAREAVRPFKAKEPTIRSGAPASLKPISSHQREEASALPERSGGMSRFFFHVYRDTITIDEDGRELPDTHAMTSNARRSAAVFIAEEITKHGKFNPSHRIEVDDENGEHVFTLPFAALIAREGD
jgi:serine/threonine protein phosphatase 1